MAYWYFEHSSWPNPPRPAKWVVNSLVDQGHVVEWGIPNWADDRYGVGCVLVVDRVASDRHLADFVEEYPHYTALAWPEAWEE